MGPVASFFHMGGYAIYVWPAFALTVLVLGGLLVASLRTLRSREATLEGLQQRQRKPRRNRRAAEA